jgi:hypothetical protein
VTRPDDVDADTGIDTDTIPDASRPGDGDTDLRRSA